METSRRYQARSDLRAALKIFSSSLASREKGLLALLLAMLGSLAPLARTALLVANPALSVGADGALVDGIAVGQISGDRLVVL